MIGSLRKMKPAERRALMIEEVKGILGRANKAARFLDDDHKALLSQAEGLIQEAGATVSSMSDTQSTEARMEIMAKIKLARDLARQIDEYAEKLGDELKAI